MARFGRYRIADGNAFFAQIDEASGKLWPLVRAPWLGVERAGQAIERTGAVQLAPVEPRKIACVGRNYAAHAAELGNEVPEEPLLFLKPPSALIGPGEAVLLPPSTLSNRIEHEVELAIVVGARLKRASEAQASAAIFGYTIAGDITARDLQKKDKQWTRAKGMDSFCPVGPEIVTGLDVSAIGVRCFVNGEKRQDGSTEQMIYSPAALLSFISQCMTLEPGDLLLTGTPAGVGPLSAGNTLRMEVDGIGALELTVRACSDE